MINANWKRIIQEWTCILLASGGIISFICYLFEDAGINTALLGILFMISFAVHSIIWKIEQLEKKIKDLDDLNYQDEI